MNKSLDLYDTMPASMLAYITHYGFHFSKKACEYAIKKMRRLNSEGKMVGIKPITKDEVDQKLRQHNIELEHNELYDATYLYHMLVADSLGSSLEDEKHLLLNIKDRLDDPDGSDELPFRCFIQCSIATGHPIEFADLLD